MILKLNLTVENYKLLRQGALDKSVDLYPSYDRVLEMKQICTPEAIYYGNDEAKASMENVLKHRISRLMGLNPEISDEMERIRSTDKTAKFKMYYKYGAGMIHNKLCGGGG